MLNSKAIFTRSSAHLVPLPVLDKHSDTVPLLPNVQKKGDVACPRIQPLSIGGLCASSFVDSLLTTSPDDVLLLESTESVGVET